MKKYLAFLALFLLLLLALSVYLQLEVPQPTGRYSVGRTIFRWVDEPRAELITADPDDVREIIGMVRYPAIPGTGITDAYFPGLPVLADDLVESGEVTRWEVLGMRWIRTNSQMDAQPITDEGPFPVILLAPGNGTNIEFYSSLASELASHGYVVVGINHPYDVAAVELSDGTVVPYDKGQWSLDAASHQSYIQHRHSDKVADMLYVLDQLGVLNSDTSSPFVGMLDLEAIAAAGHSLGGLAAADACKADARFKACINLDGLQQGGPFSMDERATPPTQPFLFLTKESQLHPKLVQIFESTTESYWVVVHGAAHASFTDGPGLQPALFPISSPADRHMESIKQYTLAFLEKTLMGSSSRLPLRSIEQEDVSVRVFPSP